MDFEQIDTYLLSKKGATFDYPFDETYLQGRRGPGNNDI